jgi:hypothetical protein
VAHEVGGFVRGGVIACIAVLVLVLADGAGAGVTTIDPYGTTLLDGRKVFPIVLAKGPERDGLTPRGTNGVDEIVAAGVNFLKVGPADTAWNDADLADALAWSAAAHARGVHTWVNLATLSRATAGSPRATRLREVVTALRTDDDAAAVAMWKGADEPWWAKTPADQLQYAYCLATSRGDRSWCAGETPLDADHLWVTIQAPRGEPADLAPYSAVTDIHGVDHYPVTLANPQPNLHEIGFWTDLIGSVTPNQATWTTLQVCASGSGDGTTYVLPSREQERYMIYDAIINGARSLAFYGGNIYRCWNDRDDQLQWNWFFWDTVLADLIREVNAVSPIAPALVNPETTQVLSSSDPETQVIARRGATNDDVWVIAARHGQGTQSVTIGGLPAGIRSGTVYTEGRSVAVADGSFTDTFERWGVHVYHFRIEPPPAPPTPPPAAPPPASPPPAPPPPTISATSVAARLVSTGVATVPSKARAGRILTLRVRLSTNTGKPVLAGGLRCSARVGKTSLRTRAKGWKRGAATCSWRLPRAARGKTLRASVRVASGGLALTRSVTRRVR